jgi:molecular chaperone DnaK
MLAAMAKSPLYVGIDLGTTNSTAAVFDGEKVTLVRSSSGANLTPSVVRIDGRNTVTVGARARRFLETDPNNTRSEFKRLMGTAQKIEFAAAKITRSPEELAAEVLKSLRADVKEHLGFAPMRAVISVPALFELPQSAATSEAARLAGFEKVELIQEPVASALAAGWTSDGAQGSWLVYDLGGGTFDVSLLETRDGLLRVVGHDGDNFLGGRDFDWALVDWVLAEVSKSSGVTLARSDTRIAASLRKLKLAVEDAKIELTRATETALALPGAFEVEGQSIDVDVIIPRSALEEVAIPLVDRSIAVCRRLLAQHGVAPSQLGRIVLVGGPTVMPVLRERVKEALGAPFGEALDPMTLVAQGAAIYAATAGLIAQGADKADTEAPGLGVWLQHPAMSSDLTPHVVGRLVSGGGQNLKLKVARADGLWSSPEIAIDAEGAFVLTVDLIPRRPNVFTIEAVDEKGAKIRLKPSTFTIVQGMTISDPPLSRTIGVALANNAVRVYFERGAPLPARRSFVHHTVEGVAKGSKECLLKIPIVQGEHEQAHLCRLVGALEIGGSEVRASLPSNSAVEITLELDRGGHLSAKALVVSLGQVFEHVAHLLVPDASPDSLEATLAAMRTRITALKIDAMARDAAHAIGKLTFVECALSEVDSDVAAARGGDADAGQKARRSLLELDAMLEEAEGDKRWPELDEGARKTIASASVIVAQYGLPAEQQLLTESIRSVEAARKARNPTELQRQLRVVKNLQTAAFYRHPKAWEWNFEDAASEADRATDLVKAQSLVKEGRRALEKGDKETLKGVVEELWRLLPATVQDRRMGHDSGVR